MGATSGQVFHMPVHMDGCPCGNYRCGMDTSTARGSGPFPYRQRGCAYDLSSLLAATADMLAHAGAEISRVQDPQATLATLYHVTQCLDHLQSAVTSCRDIQALELWESGKSQAEIALLLHTTKGAVRAILTEGYIQASAQKQAAYARRVAEEFEAEARVEVGNLFALQQ